MTKTFTWRLLRFSQMDAGMLYDILRLRGEVFVVEQQCVYQDLDNKDHEALHLVCLSGRDIAAYARIFGPGDYFEECSIGRFIVAPAFRRTGLGHSLIEESLDVVERSWGAAPVTISAQAHLEKFYGAHGFAKVGEPYPEDGIPHIRMRRP